jgi:glycosyltransferase involved in cell wall biosynthesis
MPTANRRRFVPSAIRMFLAQDYAEKELIILDDGTDQIRDIVPTNTSQISYFREEPKGRFLGGKRNRACELAHGDFILHWDDDDWYAAWRISYQVQALKTGGFDLNGINNPFFVDVCAQEAWEYVQTRPKSSWLCGATLGYRKSFWEAHRFPDIQIGEDTRFVYSARGARVGALQDNRFFVARVHGGNTSTKRLHGRWPTRSIELIHSVVGSEWELYFGGSGGLPQVGDPKWN